MAYKPEEIEEIFNKILIKISIEGKAIRNILKESNMPSNETFFKWLDGDELKAKQYARACEQRADVIFDEMLDISDTTIEGIVIEIDDNGRTKEKRGDMLGHRKLQVDTRKFMVAKLNPKKYGDKLQQEITGEHKVTISFED